MNPDPGSLVLAGHYFLYRNLLMLKEVFMINVHLCE